MSARKVRPKKGDPVIPGMSLRDIAAALGTSHRQLLEWRRLAQVPNEQFEAVLAAPDRVKHLTAAKIINMVQPRTRSSRVERCAHCGQVIPKARAK